MPNVLFSTEEWKQQANQLDAIEEPTCFNKLKHVEPMVFKDTATLSQHTTICYGKVATGVQVSQPAVVARGRARTQSKGAA